MNAELLAEKRDKLLSYNGPIPAPNDMDPRPDLVRDTETWGKLLREAQRRDPDLAGILNGMRAGGTLLEHQEGRWKLVPLIDMYFGFASIEEYEGMRDQWLKPVAAKVAYLLKGLPASE